MHRVLIIDDMASIHEDFHRILGAEQPRAGGALAQAKAALFGSAEPVAPQNTPSFEVDTALQGQEGWSKVVASVEHNRPYSVAFVDMRMPPGWDGLQTIERLWEADRDLQVVICTAHSDHSWEEIRARLGLTDRLLILKKPFDPVEVIQLATALSEKWVLKRQASLKLEELERLVRARTDALAHTALHDELTGLPNRYLCSERLARAVDAARRGGPGYAVFFLDFDRFKLVNDSLGHDAGDRLLREVAGRLTSCLAGAEFSAASSSSLAARMGGDEFVILAEGVETAEAASGLAEYLTRRLAEPYAVEGLNLSATASIGITTSALGYTSSEGPLRDADTAMYHAKAAGKARYVLFDRRMHESAKERLRLEQDLRGAVDRGEFVLHYQPVVCLSTGNLHGFEALVRWNRPGEGLVGPDRFIPCAEEMGAIIPLGSWVLREACAKLAAVERTSGAAAGSISVNVSAKQLASPRLIEQVDAALRESGIEPGRLILEITESAVIGDPDAAAELLRRLKQIGVRLHMDDFGTGYSSLSYLHRLPLDGLKMDRSFMRGIGERREYAAVVQAIITLAHNLGMTVIAEGVETPEQVALLQSMECGFAQGYYFGRPAPEPALCRPPTRAAA